MKLDEKFVLVFLLSFVSISLCEHLIVGDVANKQLIHHAVERYNAIPFIKRVKNFFYNSPKQKIINAIIAYDNKHSKATASVTAGGVGYTFVNIRMKSERGEGLEYDIGIYS